MHAKDVKWTERIAKALAGASNVSHLLGKVMETELSTEKLVVMAGGLAEALGMHAMKPQALGEVEEVINRLDVLLTEVTKLGVLSSFPTNRPDSALGCGRG